MNVQETVGLRKKIWVRKRKLRNMELTYTFYTTREVK